MGLKFIFKIDAFVILINGMGFLFVTTVFSEMGGLTMSTSLMTLGQFMGVTFIFLSLLAWKTPSATGISINTFGKIWALGHFMWLLIIGYHIVINQVGGLTAFLNIFITGIFSILYYIKSKD